MMPSEMERTDKASRISRIFCKNCHHDMKCATDPKTGKATHGCEECWVYWLMNSTVEGKDLEEPERKA